MLTVWGKLNWYSGKMQTRRCSLFCNFDSTTEPCSVFRNVRISTFENLQLPRWLHLVSCCWLGVEYFRNPELVLKESTLKFAQTYPLHVSMWSKKKFTLMCSLHNYNQNRKISW
jgi:hypothetical protein